MVFDKIMINFVEKEKQRISSRMLTNRKLGLVFDIDQTLIHVGCDYGSIIIMFRHLPLWSV